MIFRSMLRMFKKRVTNKNCSSMQLKNKHQSCIWIFFFISFRKICTDFGGAVQFIQGQNNVGRFYSTSYTHSCIALVIDEQTSVIKSTHLWFTWRIMVVTGAISKWGALRYETSNTFKVWRNLSENSQPKRVSFL